MIVNLNQLTDQTAEASKRLHYQLQLSAMAGETVVLRKTHLHAKLSTNIPYALTKN
jgi:hypothetical protein